MAWPLGWLVAVTGVRRVDPRADPVVCVPCGVQDRAVVGAYEGFDGFIEFGERGLAAYVCEGEAAATWRRASGRAARVVDRRRWQAEAPAPLTCRYTW